MALGTYTELQASILTWMQNASLSSLTPDLVTLAEARIARDLRLRRQISTTNLSTVADTQTVAVPSDWLETENITLMTSIPRNLGVITPEQMDARFPLDYYAGEPRYYTMIGSSIILGPTPDAVYTISLDYYAKFPALADNSTNWLLTNHPQIYLYACLHEASLYTKEHDQAAMYLQKYTLDKDALQDQDDIALRSGSAMRVKAL